MTPPALLSFSLSLASGWFLLILLILAAVAWSIFAYARTVPEITTGRRILLTSLRAIGLSLLVFIVFEPILNLLREETLEPRIALVMDNSASMTIQDPSGDRAALVWAFATSSEADALMSAGEADAWIMSSGLRPLMALTPDSLPFNGQTTDIDAALTALRESQEGRNLRAVVLVTDGVPTTGRNPLYAAEALGVPVYTVGVGDSSEQKDVLIGSVIANELAYLESTLPIDAIIRTSGIEAAQLQVTLRDGQNEVDRRVIDARQGGGEYPVRFTYTPKEEGMRKLRIDVSTVPGELTTKNNSRTLFVRVLKSRMTIALVAGAPSPDVSLFEQAMVKDRNVAVQSYIQKLGSSWYGAAPTEKSFTDADAIVLIGYPTAQTGDNTMQLIRNAVEKAAKPLWIIFSREIDLRKLRQHLDAWLPFDVVQERSEEMQVSLVVGPDARQNPVVSSGLSADLWDRLPPLFKTETSLRARVGTQTLATMKINGIAFNEPLLMQRKIGSSRTIVLAGYGLWRWQMAYDVVDGLVPETLLANAIRWMTTRDDTKRFSVKPVRELFGAGEPVDFTGQVYNESYEPVSDATVTLKVRGPQGEQELTLTAAGAGRYTGSLDGLPEGDYTYTGTATGAQTLTDNGRFSVGEANAEFLDTRMNNALLRLIAARTGGRFFPIGNTQGLADAVTRAPTFTPQTLDIRTDIQLWNLAWLLGAVIAIFAVEWYLRKQAGMM